MDARFFANRTITPFLFIAASSLGILLQKPAFCAELPDEVAAAWQSLRRSFPAYCARLTLRIGGAEDTLPRGTLPKNEISFVASLNGSILRETQQSRAIELVSPPFAGTKEGNRKVVGRNSDYVFKLSRPPVADDWELDSLEWDGTQHPPTKRVLDVTPDVYGLQIAGYLLPELLSSGALTVTGISEDDGAEGPTLTIELVRTKSGEAGGMRVERAQVELGKRVGWQILNAEVKQGLGEVTGSYTIRNTYASPAHVGRPVVVQMTGTESWGSQTEDEPSLSVGRFVQVKWLKEMPSESDFRLPAFGLPEPTRHDSSGSN